MKSKMGRELDVRSSSLFNSGDGEFTSQFENKLEIKKGVLALSQLML